MDEQGQDQVQLTEKERLVGEVKAKLSEFLRQDGRELFLADLGPSLNVVYSLDLPLSIAGIEIDPEVDPNNKIVDARLIVNQKTNTSGPFSRLTAIVEILGGGKKGLSYKFIFNQGVPSFQYQEPKPDKRFYSWQASAKELADFKQLLNSPLYLKDSPQ